MNFGDMVLAVFNDPVTGGAIKGVVLLGLLDLVLGLLRAVVPPNSFQLSLIDVWVRTQLAGRILPILIALIVSSVAGDITIGDFSFNLLETAALAGAAVYAAATAKSIFDSVNPRAADPLPSVNEDTAPTE